MIVSNSYYHNWPNEGFASYSKALWFEHAYPRKRDLVKTKAIFPLILILFLLLLIFACSVSTYSNDPLDTERFEYVLYDGLKPKNILEIAENLEANYQRIVADLKVKEMPKIIVKIWADYNHFLNDMENDIGIRYTGATGYVFGIIEARVFYNSDAPVTAVHEFSHLVSIQVNSTIPNNPRWLWESVALYENNEFVDPITLPYMVSGNYPTLAELNTNYNFSNQYIYSVGYVLLEYVVQTWGMDDVIELIKSNGNISNSLGITTQEFETGWYQFVEGKYLTN